MIFWNSKEDLNGEMQRQDRQQETPQHEVMRGQHVSPDRLGQCAANHDRRSSMCRLLDVRCLPIVGDQVYDDRGLWQPQRWLTASAATQLVASLVDLQLLWSMQAVAHVDSIRIGAPQCSWDEGFPRATWIQLLQNQTLHEVIPARTRTQTRHHHASMA
mmetsp:Transcript_30944/g.98741  ORF Transcript_30944/g.98741 Transcript_30944/m.98741 type:complete len:159 (-) Transcript_30944:164-640(-)